MPYRMVFSGHSAGGEFVVVAADALRRADPVAYRRLAGLMLLDPVNSFFGVNFASAAAVLGAERLPIRVIASQPSVSNNFGQGVSVLQRTTRQDFLGSRLVTGIHIDAEGESTDLVGELSGLAAPRPRNGRVLRALATGWSSDMVADTVTATYYPGGRYYDLLLDTRTVTTLPVR
jgi:acetyl esterase/lipase